MEHLNNALGHADGARGDRWGALWPATFIACFFFALYAGSVGWWNDVAGFRQSQTALDTYYLIHGPLTLRYDTPVFGPPWSMPFEFPTFQFIVAIVVRVFHTPLNQTGRFFDFAFFLLTLVPSYVLLGTLNVARRHRLLMLSLFLVSPYYLFWSRSFMIESTAVCIGMAYLACVAMRLKALSEGPNDAAPRRTCTPMLIAALLIGSIAAVTKITTFVPFGFAAGLLGAISIKRTLKMPSDARLKRARLVRQTVLLSAVGGVPLLAAAWWTNWTDQIKLQNPMAAMLTSKNLKGFNFGTLQQRLTPAHWLSQIGRTSQLVSFNFYSFALLAVACAVALLISRRRWKEAAISFGLFWLAPLLFFNLHIWHLYYTNANGIFMIAAVGFCLLSMLEAAPAAGNSVTGTMPGMSVSRYVTIRRAGVVLSVLTLLSFAVGYRTRFFELQLHPLDRYQSFVQQLRKDTPPGSVIICIGLEYSSSLPYVAERRALTVPFFWDPPAFATELQRLRDGGYHVSAIVIREPSPMSKEYAIHAMKDAGIPVPPVYVFESGGALDSLEDWRVASNWR